MLCYKIKPGYSEYGSKFTPEINITNTLDEVSNIGTYMSPILGKDLYLLKFS